MNHKIFLLMFLFLLVGTMFVDAVCIVEVDQESDYRPGETVTVSGICTEQIEKNRAYTMTWSNGTTLQTDIGVTPSTVNTPFFETYLIPDSAQWLDATVTLAGTNLEGSDTFNVSGNNSKLLLINDAFFTPNALMGNLYAVDFRVFDSFGKNIDNANCVVYGTDNNDAPLQLCGYQRTFHGRAICEGILDRDVYTEGNQYLAKIRCSCGEGDNACFDEDGLTVEKKSGERVYPFTIGPWLIVNTITDKNSYNLADESISICANVTNLQGERIEAIIEYSYRCGSGDNATDRILYDSFLEDRGIDSNTTQTQCATLKITNEKFMQNKLNNCYASTDIVLLDRTNVGKFSYHTTSPMFTIDSNSNISTNGVVPIILDIILLQLFLIAFFIIIGIPYKPGFTKFFSWSMAIIELLITVWMMYIVKAGGDINNLLYVNAYGILVIGGLLGFITLFKIMINLMRTDKEKTIEDDGYTKWLFK